MPNKVLLELCDAATMPVHPVTGERALFWGRSGRPVWPMAGGAPDGDSDGGDGKGGDGDDGKSGTDGGDGKAGDGKGADGESGKDKGYPSGTSIDDMTPAQQAAYHQAKANRYMSTLKGFGKHTPESVKELQAKYDALVKTGQTDQERAVAEAQETAREQARREAAPQLVEAAFARAANGRMTDEQIEALVEDIDPMKYMTDGKVDRDKVAAKVAKLVGPVRGGKGPDLGQGRRRDVAQSGREAGREAAARRFGDRARSASKS